MKLRILFAVILICVGANAATGAEDLPKATRTVPARSDLNFLDSIDTYNATPQAVANFEAEALEFAEKYKTAEDKTQIDREFQRKIAAALNQREDKNLHQHLSAFYNAAKVISQ
jgi:hypothetical protein